MSNNSSTDIAERLRAISISPIQHPGLNSRIRDTCSDGAAEIDHLRAELAAAHRIHDEMTGLLTTKVDAIERIEAALRDCRWGYLRPAIADLREAISILEAAIGDQPMPNDITVRPPSDHVIPADKN